MDNEIDLSRHPFYFNIDLINKEINFWLYKKNHREALKILEDVEYKWFKAKNEDRIPSGSGYEHLKTYSMQSLMNRASNLKRGKKTENVDDFFATWLDKKIKSVKDKIGSEDEVQKELVSEKTQIKEEKYSGSTRYLILDEFFELKREFKDLSQNKIIKLLSIILEKDNRTTKGYKNGEEKYIKKESKNRATELINKVKKGDYL